MSIDALQCLLEHCMNAVCYWSMRMSASKQADDCIDLQWLYTRESFYLLTKNTSCTVLEVLTKSSFKIASLTLDIAEKKLGRGEQIFWWPLETHSEKVSLHPI